MNDKEEIKELYHKYWQCMKDDLTARFARDLPPELADVRIGIRDVEKLQGESYRGISFRSGDSPVEANLNMTSAFQAYEAGRPYRKSGYSKKFFEEHRAEITLHKAAKEAFNAAGGAKLPTIKELRQEYA